MEKKEKGDDIKNGLDGAAGGFDGIFPGNSEGLDLLRRRST